jgi:HAD superfamily hydrolase (TIGR01509 family)
MTTSDADAAVESSAPCPASARPSIRGVIFDMDGVLVASEPFTAEAAIRVFAEKGYTVDRQEFRPFLGTGEARFMGGVAEARGIPFDPVADVDHLYRIYLGLIPGRLGPLAGAQRFALACRDRGLLLAVASSANRIKVVANLAEVGLPDGTFDAVVTGCDVARKKPAPDIFLEAARRLGLDPASCLVVEDAPAGIAAARAAGCRCLALTTTMPATSFPDADWIAPDLDHVPPEATGW